MRPFAKWCGRRREGKNELDRMSEKSGSVVGLSILGGTGYGAGEILRLLIQHPKISVVDVVSSSQAGEKISSVHSHLSGFYDANFENELSFKSLAEYEHRYLLTALPHGTSANKISELIEKAQEHEVRILDLSGDLRLSDASQRARYYPESNADSKLQQSFCYGLPELYREDLQKARHVSNPGCFATAAVLAAAPIVRSGRHRGKIIFDGKSGSSGGGKSPNATFHHPERHGNVNAYKVLEHRHEPEIAQALGDAEGKSLQTSFTPHVVPLSRGMYVTSYLDVAPTESKESLLQCYKEFYADAPFVRIRETPSELEDVVGSNFCDIFIAVREEQVVVTAALDNLVKGMAGQAIQNINVSLGFPETLGLWTPSLRPI